MDTRSYGFSADETIEAPHHPLALFTNIECRAWIGALVAFRARPVRRAATIERRAAASLDDVVTAASTRAIDVPTATLARGRSRASILR